MGKPRVRRDRILFVDLELTCWEDSPPPGEFPEIIEIGLAEVDAEALVVTRTGSCLVRPEHSSVSAYCERLTGLSAERLRRHGRPLREAFASMRREWGTASKPWMAWGSDRRAVLADCERKRCADPFSDSFHDIGMQFTLLAGFRAGVGLRQASRLLGVPCEGREHSGMDDAAQAALAWTALARIVREKLGPDPAAVPGGP